MAGHVAPQAEKRRAKRSPIGSAPGTLIADPKAHPTRMRATLVSPDGIRTIDELALDAVPDLRKHWPLIWVDCVGLGTVETIEGLGGIFGIHRLVLEDIVNTGQRPKTDLFDDYAYVVLRMFDSVHRSVPEQISLVFGTGFVLTFAEDEGDCFDPVRQRLAVGGRLWSRKSDYLAYALLDAVVDAYFPLLDAKSDAIDRMEDELLAGASKEQASVLHHMRREIIQAKRWLWPVRDAIGTLMRAEHPFIHAETRIYLNDTYDHAVRVVEMTETLRETLTGLIELHLAMSQAKINEVINLLTIVSTIFIPLTFLVGVWGMNFDTEDSPWNMPELSAYYGYPIALLVMLAIAVALVAYFRWKKWL